MELSDPAPEDTLNHLYTILVTCPSKHPSRFKKRGHKPHHWLERIAKSHCKGACGMGNIVAAFFVKYNIPYIGVLKKKWTRTKEDAFPESFLLNWLTLELRLKA